MLYNQSILNKTYEVIAYANFREKELIPEYAPTLCPLPLAQCHQTVCSEVFYFLVPCCLFLIGC